MEVCRICNNPSADVRNVFCETSDGKQILQLIRETLPIVIYRNDPLSKQICLGCLENIEKIRAFRSSSLEILDRQREALRNRETKSKDALLYLQLLEHVDQKELWMYSSPVKKTFENKSPICINCKADLSATKIAEKPFKRYKESPRKLDSLQTVNGSLNQENLNRKRKRFPVIDLECVETGSLPKRKRIVGPKCVSQPFLRTIQKEELVFNPLSLLNLSLNVINGSIVPEVASTNKHFKRDVDIVEEEEYDCEYCLTTFANQEDLARHEVSHMQINLRRADNLEIWNSSKDDSTVRNKWLQEEYGEDEEEEEEGEEENLLVPMGEAGEQVVIGDIELIDKKPVVNGIPLGDIPKLERRAYFNKNCIVNGLKRKFCPLCRYTFKDNWAIELHYFSSACYYTCRYCGIRFNKQRASFDEHIKGHLANGDPPTDKVYASRKKNDPIPQVLDDGTGRRKPPIAIVCENPSDGTMKVMERRRARYKSISEIKNEEEGSPTSSMGGQSQAYFCRKCYKVFFKLDEFSRHTAICDGGPLDDEILTPEKKPQIKQEPKLKLQEPKVKQQKTPPASTASYNESGVKVSSTGRPVRNCVRDIRYKDHPDIEIEAEEDGSHAKTPNSQRTFDFECVICHAIFPTMLSRNSHMRVHKNGYGQKSTNNYNYKNSAYEEVVTFKQEQLEPLVEIHETNTEQDSASNIGAVSITPIPNKKHKTSINPDIMRLVQSNPNITIRSMNESPLEPQTLLAEGGGDRTYKCSSCSKTFTSKSTLYFHKKHQCEGSRYPCPFCKKRFGTESAYSAHIFYSHPE